MKMLMPLIKRVRGSIPKGATPDDPVARAALKGEIDSLDVSLHGPTPRVPVAESCL
jgi:hypothetical protein